MNPMATVANPWPVNSLSLSWVNTSAATDKRRIGRRQRGEPGMEDPGGHGWRERGDSGDNKMSAAAPQLNSRTVRDKSEMENDSAR